MRIYKTFFSSWERKPTQTTLTTHTSTTLTYIHPSPTTKHLPLSSLIMQLTNILFAGLIFTGVQALPSPAPIESLEIRSTCSRIFPQPKSLTCDGEGYIRHDSNKIGSELNTPSVEACADLCKNTAGCRSIRFRWGACQRWGGSFSSLGFYNAKSDSWWYQMDCFRC